MYFDELELNNSVLDALYDMRFEKCTPVQEKCIPEILNGNDVLGVAQTGTRRQPTYCLFEVNLTMEISQRRPLIALS